MKPFHIFLAVLVMAMWGINFVVIKVGLDSFPPLLLSAFRFGLAGLPILFILNKRPASLTWIIAIALSLGVFKFSLLFIGMSLGAEPGLTSLVLQMQAFFTVLFAFFLLGERPNKRQMSGMLLAFIGLGLIMQDIAGQSFAFTGISLVILAAVFWGLNNIAMRKAQSTNPLHLIIWVSAFSAPMLFAISWIVEGEDQIVHAVQNFNMSGALSVSYLAFVATLAGFGLWAYLLKTYEAGKVAPFSLLVPIFGMSSSALLLGEEISSATFIAALFIIAGLYLNTVPPTFFKRPKPC